MRAIFSTTPLLVSLLLVAGLAVAGCDRRPVDVPEPVQPVEPAPAPAEAPPLLDYTELLTGGADGSTPLPLVIAIHGRGDKPESFCGLLKSWPVEARVVCPQAIHDFPASGGWSWFNVRASGSQEQLAEEVGEAADRIAQLTDALCAEKGCPVKPAVMGFSQGGMLSFTLAVRHPDVYAGAVPISGFLPSLLVPEAGARVAPIRALHGDADPVVKPEWARESITALKTGGFDATLQEYPGVVHTISRDMRAELDTSLRALLTPDSP